MQRQVLRSRMRDQAAGSLPKLTSATDDRGHPKALPRMTTPPPTSAADLPPRHQPMGFAEFVILVACLLALVSLAISMMLAVLGEIGRTWSIETTRTQSVLTAF